VNVEATVPKFFETNTWPKTVQAQHGHAEANMNMLKLYHHQGTFKAGQIMSAAQAST